MIFHLSYEIPKPQNEEPGCNSEGLTAREGDLLRDQIRKNTEMINSYIERLDLLVNKEGYPKKLEFIEKIRQRLYLLMEENDTFRKVLWQFMKKEVSQVFK